MPYVHLHDYNHTNAPEGKFIISGLLTLTPPINA